MSSIQFSTNRNFIFLICICCICNYSSAQILSVAPGTEFSVKRGTNLVADRADINFSGDFIFSNNTLTADLDPKKITNVSNMQRMYIFTNPVYYLPAKISLNYLETELNDLPESELRFLYDNGIGWEEDYSSILYAGGNYLENGAATYTKLAAFTAGKYQVSDELIQVRANPNPSATEFNVMVLAKEQGDIELTCVDMRGAVLIRMKTKPNQTVKLGRDFPMGAFIIRAVQGKKPMAAIKVVKS